MKSKCFLPQRCTVLYLIWIPTLRRSQRRKSMRQCDQSMIWVWDCGGSTVGGGRLLRVELEKDFLACFPPRILGLNIILYFSTKSFVFDICHNLRQESWERRRQLKHWLASSKTRLRGFLQRRWLSTISLLLRYRGCLWFCGAYHWYDISNILISLSSGPGGKVISALTARAGSRGVPETPSREVFWRGEDGRSVSGATKNTTILIWSKVTFCHILPLS